MFGAIAARLRSFPRPFRILLAGVVVNRIATFIFPFLTLLLVPERGFSVRAAGLVLLAVGAGSVASLLFGGVLADALGRRRTMIASMLGGGVLAAALGFVDAPVPFAVLLVLYVFVADLYRPAVFAVVADLLPPPERAAGIAALRVCINLGLAVGVSLGGLLQDLGPRVLFPADGLTTILFGLMVWAGVPETRAAGSPGDAVRPGALLRAVAGDGVLATILLCTVAWSLFMVAFITVLPRTLEEWAGYPPLVYGFTFGINGLMVALFQVGMTDRVAGRRRLRIAAAGMLLGGACISAVPALRHWSWILAVMALFTFGEMIVLPGVTAFVADWAPPSMRGTYLGVHQSAFSLALLLGPPVMLPLRERLGEARFWPLFSVVAFPAALVLLRLDARDPIRGDVGPGRPAG